MRVMKEADWRDRIVEAPNRSEVVDEVVMASILLASKSSRSVGSKTASGGMCFGIRSGDGSWVWIKYT